MDRKITALSILLIAGVVIAGVSVAIASVTEKHTADKAINTQISVKENKDVKVTIEDAKKIALLAVPGTIVKEELKNGTENVVYNIEINNGKTTIAVKIDAVTGTVLEKEIED
jgi:uncharacterized membrane protein YkoI